MINLLPYVKEELKWNIQSEIIKKIWDKLAEEGLHTIVFYDADIRNRDQFLEFMQMPTNLPLIIFANKQIAGFAWLNSVSAKFAFSHFAFFKSSWGKFTDEIGKKVLDYWFSIPDDDGSQLFDTLIGAVPEFNQRAIKYAERIGYTKLGTIPEFSDFPYLGERRGVTLLYRKP